MATLKTLKTSVQILGQREINTIDPSSWRSGKSSTQRGYGYKWQRSREGWLKAHPLCVYCQRLGRVAEGTVVDHIVPHRGDMTLFWDRSNWQTLCKLCHDSVKQVEEAGLG